MLITVLGILVARRARAEPSPLAGATAGRRYGIIVGSEFASIGAGAAILGSTGHTEFIAAWACFVVGVHFLPLSKVFPGIGMVGVAGVIVLVAVAAPGNQARQDRRAQPDGEFQQLQPPDQSAAACMGAGTFLLGHAVSLLLAARHLRLPGQGNAPGARPVRRTTNGPSS